MTRLSATFKIPFLRLLLNLQYDSNQEKNSWDDKRSKWENNKMV